MKAASLVFALLISLLGSAPFAVAADLKAEQAAQATDAAKAKALLDKAASYYEKQGESALAAFSRQGEFIDGDNYVYVISTEGEMLASGGTSAALIGRKVLNFTDAQGKPFFRDMIDQAMTKGSGEVTYRWLNRTDNKVERKLAYFRRVKDRIIAVGYYIPRATPEEAKALLDRAVAAVEAKPAEAIAKFNELRGPFIQDDLYVFVMTLDDGRFVAHGTQPRLVGSAGKELTDPDGKPIGTMILDKAKSGEKAELEYSWRNPVTRKVEQKHTFLRRTGNYVVGVGYYTR